jgi:membrane protease YdiL (CAAX protease family)
MAKHQEARETMNQNDENLPLPPEPSSGGGATPSVQPQTSTPLEVPGNPLNYTPILASKRSIAESQFPLDLQITWFWVHGLVFALFILITLSIVPVILVLKYAPHQRLTDKQLQEFLVSQPIVTIGSTVIVYGLLLFFLYMTLAVLREKPFWKSLGWRKIQPRLAELPKNPVVYFFAGGALSLLVAIATSVLKTPENTPIEQVFHHRKTALLFLSVAVLVAPLVEETIFRGYLYPLFVRIISAILRGLGFEDAPALRSGIFSSVLLTGILFGLMHGPQLGGAKSLILVLIIVGIVFTVVRAETGSTFASFMMHLGYNSLISIFALIGTHGFTKIPPGH